MRALRATRLAEMDQRGDATKTFYAALTPPQQKAFDALTARRMGAAWGVITAADGSATRADPRSGVSVPKKSLCLSGTGFFMAEAAEPP